MLIPYKGVLPTTITQDNKEQQEAIRRGQCLISMRNAISMMENKLSQQGKLAKIPFGTKFDKEAKYYLEENDYDF